MKLYQYIYNLWLALTGRYLQTQASNEALGNHVKSLQQLVENLRERIIEKDRELQRMGVEYSERMERMKADYQLRIETYNQEIDRLVNPKKSKK